MTDPIEVHKALADQTRYRLYRYLRLSGRGVSVREISARLSLHANTVRPHLRRLEDVGLVTSDVMRQPATVGRPQKLYTAVEREGRQGRDYRLLADILASTTTTKRQRERAEELARQWGTYLLGQATPRPGASRRRGGPDLAALQSSLAEAGFDPRFHRRGARIVEITLRECPFRELAEEHGELVNAIHRGLLEGMLAASRPPMVVDAMEPMDPQTGVAHLRARKS
jgi:predicted ArsR family transcriptional regulator